MNLKFVANYQRGIVDIQLYDEIGTNPETGKGISGRGFAAEIQYLDCQPDVETIRVRINSPGGLVIDALSIFNAIRNCTKNVETYIDGVAASSAGLVAMAGKKRYINDFARLMIHAPSIPEKDRENMDAATLETLDHFSEMIADLLSNNSTSKRAKVLGYVQSQKWFTAKDALKEGFVDEIINTGRTMPVNITETSNVAEVYNTISTILNSNTQMKLNEVKNKLGLTSESTDEQVLDKVNNLITAKGDAETKLTNATNDLNAAKAENVELTKKAATAIVNSAISAGKIGAEKRDELIAEGVKNLGALETLIAAVPTPAANVQNHINPNDQTAGVGKVINGKFNGKTLRELDKTEPQTVANLLANDLPTYKELYKAQYGTEYTA